MSHDYDYRIGGQPLVGTGLARRVVLEEGSAGQRAELVPAAWRPGVVTGRRHYPDARLVTLVVHLPHNDAHGAKHRLDGLFAGGGRLSRLDPHAGLVSTRILWVDATTQGSGSARYVWPYQVWMVDGYWAGERRVVTVAGVSDGTMIPVAVGGTLPTRPTITFTCVTDGAAPSVAATDGAAVGAAGSYRAGQVIVIDTDTGEVTVDGVASTSILQVNRGYLLELDMDVGSLAFAAGSGTWDVTVAWAERWR